MDLLSIIIFFAVIAKIFKKNDPKKYEETVRKAKDIGGEVLGEIRGEMKNRRENYEKQYRDFEQKVTRGATQTQQANTYEMPKHTQRVNSYEMPTQNARTTPAYEQVNKSRMEAEKTSILERAKANAEEDKEDITLRSLEESHGHSAKVAPAIHDHSEDIISENSVEKIQDLIVKGYEVDLCFERDFLGEAMDMVNRFSMGGSV